MGAFTHPKVIDLTIATADSWGLWHYPDFEPLKDLAQALQEGAPARAGLLPARPRLRTARSPRRSTRSPTARRITSFPTRRISARAKKATSSTSGRPPSRPTRWFSPPTRTRCAKTTSQRPSYWASNGRLPRSAQYRNLLVSLYNIDRHPSPSILEARHYGFTHAYFPKWAFDQVVEAPAAGRRRLDFWAKGEGYVALYSHLPYRWQTEGPDAGQEVIALGLQNVWICQMGRKAVDGSFEEFILHITQADLEVDGLNVNYAAPGVGQVEFGWSGPLLVDGRETPLQGYARFGSVYGAAPFGSGVYRFELGEQRLDLDFNTGTRFEQ